MNELITILSLFLLINTYGIHSIIIGRRDVNRPMYISTPLVLIPLLCGFVLPIIPWYIILEYNWILLFFINAILVYFIAPVISGIYLSLLTTKSLGKDMVFSLAAGLLTLLLAMFLDDYK
ncbi:hypothetical protein [Pedobacter frigiditerrae]|uniref:hypothetical protein n=1 Tax=Pedobacter frigiditerrae TaxID=2530452 RepID=UPI0029314961|nr:hypothetical protein [Pedobacter frigiditerrae]